MATKVEIKSLGWGNVTYRDGSAYSGASVAITDAEAQVTATVYSDVAGSATLTQPLTTNNEGEISGYLGTGHYTVTVTARDGVTVLDTIDAQVAASSDVGGLTTSVVNVKNTPYSAQGDGSTNDYSAIQDAINAAQGGIVFFPAGTYKIDCSSNPLSLINGTILVGEGTGSTTLKMAFDSAPTSALSLLSAGTTASGEVANIKLECSTFTSGAKTAFKKFGTSGTIRFTTCAVAGFTFAAQVGSTDAGNIELLDTDVQGIVGGTPTSAAVVHNGTSGALKVWNCYIHDFGGSANAHAIQVFPNIETDIQDSGFNTANSTPNCVSFYDTQDLAAAKKIVVRNCDFRSGTAGGIGATPYNTATIKRHILVDGCVFQGSGTGVEVWGNATIRDCRFLGSGTVAGVAQQGSPGGATWYTDGKVLVDGCQFAVNASAQGELDIDKANNGTTEWRVTNCRFEGTSPGWHMFWGDNPGWRVTVENCEFAGAPDTSGIGMRGAGVGNVLNCSFRITNAVPAIRTSGTAVARLHVIANEFAQSGSSVTEATAPTAKQYRENFGVTGLASNPSDT